MRLENPSENPCFGCGPGHARGLHLQPQRERAGDGVEEVVIRHTPRADEIGWPGILHMGLFFAVVYEASYWAALELGGKVHIPKGPIAWDYERLPLVGQTFAARARVAGSEDGLLRVHAEATGPDGRRLAGLDTRWKPSSRAAVERSGLKLPAYLLEDMDP